MDWLVADRTQSRPSGVAIENLWRSVDLRPLDDVPVAVSRYLEELSRVYVNGGARYARFALTGNPHFHWFATRRLWHEIDFFSHLLAHPAVRGALPGVTGGMISTHPEFEWRSPLCFGRELTELLVNGGAYLKYQGPPSEAKQLGKQVCEALFGERFEEVEFYRCQSAWSTWFCDIAWDSTFVLIDRRLQELSLLCATDTD